MIIFPEKYAKTIGEDGGLFIVPFEGRELQVIASNGGDWEHVSVSLPNRCPNWREMCLIKNIFWQEEDVVMQLHPAKSEYVNMHPYCLHLWRPLLEVIPCPPSWMVGL